MVVLLGLSRLEWFALPLSQGTFPALRWKSLTGGVQWNEHRGWKTRIAVVLPYVYAAYENTRGALGAMHDGHRHQTFAHHESSDVKSTNWGIMRRATGTAENRVRQTGYYLVISNFLRQQNRYLSLLEKTMTT